MSQAVIGRVASLNRLRSASEIERGVPPTRAIEDALDRVCKSSTFSASPQLIAFLRYVVEAVLAGRSDSIKAYTIAIDALGRDPSFDPQTDPIVRVEARRLRQLLEAYYTTEGRNDPILIKLPLGHYVPSFRRRADLFYLSDISTAARRLLSCVAAIRIHVGALILAALLTAIIGGGIVQWRQPSAAGNTTTGSNPDVATSRFSDDPLPVVYVSPIGVIGTPVKSVVTPLHLQIELCDAFARFDEIIVVTEAECGDPTRNILTPRADQLNNIDYIVSGHLDYGGGDSVSTTLRVISRSDGVVVWTRTFRPIRLDGTDDLAQDAIVRQAAMTIAQPTGVIQARERNRRAAGAKLDPRYSCLLDFNAYRQSFDPAAHESVKSCLKRAIDEDPTFALGFAALARIYTRQFYTQFGFEEDEPKPLDQALRLAQKAIELNPESAEAYAVLMGVQFARRHFMAARAAGEKAAVFNPNDMAVRAEYAFVRLRLGEAESAMAPLREAIASGYVPSPIVYYGLFTGAYLAGNLDEARHYADAIATDNFPLGLTAQALIAERSGNQDKAAQALNRLYTLQPAWKADPRHQLKKVFEAQSIVDRLANDLVAVNRSVMN